MAIEKLFFFPLTSSFCPSLSSVFSFSAKGNPLGMAGKGKRWDSAWFYDQRKNAFLLSFSSALYHRSDLKMA